MSVVLFLFYFFQISMKPAKETNMFYPTDKIRISEDKIGKHYIPEYWYEIDIAILHIWDD